MTTQGTHNEGSITFRTHTAIKERFILGKFVDGKIAPAGTDQAVAIITDRADDEDDLVNVQVLGSNAGTMKVLAASEIAIGDFITSDYSSKARSLKELPTGIYNIVGIALTNAFAGECVEFTPTLGLQKTL